MFFKREDILKIHNALTASHKATVEKLKTIEEVEAYNYKTGYPKMLEINV